MGRQRRKTTLLQSKAWTLKAKEAHRRMVRFARSPRGHNEVELLAQMLREFRRQGMYRDLGFVRFDEYVNAKWPEGFGRHVLGLERCADLIITFPHALDVLKARLIGARDLARIVRFIESEEDLLWWVRLARVTTQKEFIAIAKARYSFNRTSSALDPGRMVVLFLTRAQEEAVSQYLSLEKGDSEEAPLGPTLGQELASLCERARVARIPGALGQGHRDLGRDDDEGRQALPQDGELRDGVAT